MRVEIECPYCNKIHVHLIATTPEPEVKVEEQIEMPHDDETGDLEDYQEEKK